MEALLSLALRLVLSALSVQAQLSVTWEGDTITESTPVLIYHEEIRVDTSPSAIGDPNAAGALFCRTGDQATVAWHFANNFFLNVFPTTGDFYQIRTGTGSMSQLLAGTANINRDDALLSGLWRCKVSGNRDIPVGLYHNAPGFGRITTNQVSLLSSPFPGDPPTFTLIGDTSGGPPTTRTWTRDGVTISDGGSFSISIAVNSAGTANTAYQQGRYRSTLTVTGRLPGVYQYSVINRATSGDVTDSITIEDPGPPTDVTATQEALESVRVSWTEPSSPPSGGYRITVDSSAPAIVSSPPHFITIQQPGVHTIQVMSISLHFPSETAPPPVQVTVNGTLAPDITMPPSPAATSVTIAWTQPQYSLPVVGYSVLLTRVTGSGQELCGSFEDTRDPVNAMMATSQLLTGLRESSTYTVRVTATITFGITTMVPSSVTFTTLSAAPTGAPPNVAAVMITSRSVTLSWGTIECIERNGPITTYEAELRDLGGTVFPGQVVDRTFTASGLQIFTYYTFQVAGVNSDGTGPFSEAISFTTADDTPGAVSGLTSRQTFTSIVLTWSSPQEPNGVIINYEITFRVNDGNLVTANTTGNSTTFTIPSLTPGTRVSNILVSAYTSVGRGAAAQHDGDLMTLSQPPTVMNVRVVILTETSVRVSWDKIDISGITGYTIYYGRTRSRKRQGEQSITVCTCSSANSVVIGNLTNNVEYQFQVVAIAEVDGDVLMGQRSVLTDASIATLLIPKAVSGDADVNSRNIAITAVVTALLTLILYIAVLLVVCWVCRNSKTNWSIRKEGEDHVHTEDTYEEIATTRMSASALDVKVNVAYGPVAPGQQPPQRRGEATQPNTEGDYDNM